MFFKEIWAESGWNEKQSVWRLEFQLRKSILKQLSVHSVSSLLASQNDIWRYCTCKWLRLAVDTRLKNRTRFKTHPFWTEIQGVRFGDGTFSGIKRVVEKTRLPSVKALLNGCSGYITSFAAREGYEEVNEVTMQALLVSFKQNFNDSPKAQEYENFADYSSIMINIKKKKYNIESEIN